MAEHFLVRCRNERCLRRFHVIPEDEEQAELLEKALADDKAGIGLWITVKCPVCGDTSRQVCFEKPHCSCPHPIHAPEIETPSPPVQPEE